MQHALAQSMPAQNAPAQSIPVQSASVVTSSQPLKQVDSAISQRSKLSSIFPLPPQEAQTARTYSFFNGDPANSGVKNDASSWTLSLSIDIPSNLINPTLSSLVYFVKYATTYDSGNSTLQTDVVLSTTPCSRDLPAGRTVSNVTELGIYLNNQLGYGSRVVNEDLALCLSTVPAVKCNGGNGQWSHYIDAQRLFPDVRIVKESSLYLNFHVDEYPTAQTSRILDVQVSASWVEDLEARKAKEEAERKAKEEAARLAKEEADRLAREEVERLAKEEAVRLAKEEADRLAREKAERKAKEEADRLAREEAARLAKERADTLARQEVERKAREEVARLAREEAARLAKEEADKQAREEAERMAKAAKPPSVHDAPAVADDRMQQLIKEAASKLPGAACAQGFQWKKTSWGYQCGGGGHKLTFEQLGMSK